MQQRINFSLDNKRGEPGQEMALLYGAQVCCDCCGGLCREISDVCIIIFGQLLKNRDDLCLHRTAEENTRE